MALNDIYENSSQWLKAEDIKGSKPVVTIATAEVKENTYDGVTKKQIVLTFIGKEKQLGLNFTNAARIAELTGTEEYDEWVGTSLKLYVERVKVGSEMKDAIRIFPELPTTATPATQKAAVGAATSKKQAPAENPDYDPTKVEAPPETDVDIPW